MITELIRVPSDPADTDPPRPPAAVSALWADRGFAGLCGIAGLYVASVSLFHIFRGEPGGTWLLPVTTGALTLVLSACVACGAGRETIAWHAVARRAAALALLAAYAFVLLPLLGFLAASILLVLAVAMLYATNRLYVGAGGLIIVVGMWALFAYGLAEPLPRGLWWR